MGPSDDHEPEHTSDAGSTLEAYKIALEELRRHRAATAALLSRIQSLSLVLLGAEAYLAATSPLTNWLPVLVVCGISLFGLALMRAVNLTETEYLAREQACVTIGFKLEQKLIKEGVLDEGLLIYMNKLRIKNLRTRELKSKHPERLKNSRMVHSRQLFSVAFICVPLAFALVTFLALDPATHALVHPLLSAK